MKFLKIFSISLILLALFFRLLHFPGSSFLLLIGNTLFFMFSIFHISKTKNIRSAKSYIYLAYSLISMYILFRLLYWPGGPLIFGIRLVHIIPIVSGILFLIFYFQEEKKINFKIISFFIIFVLHVRLGIVPSHELYYHLHLNPTFYPSSYNENVFSWDRYAWFLYISGEKEKALNANLKAQSNLKREIHPTKLEQNSTYQSLKTRAFLIQIDSWENYEPLGY